jgi:hypothetical protein
MLSVTFLGHQGWLVRSKETTLLVDPLLREEFGEIHALGYRVFPPRRLDLAKLPPVDALVLSHEHDDHFDIPSLARLSRSIPVHLSARSSTAARSILGTMGFTVSPLTPGMPLPIGDLELTPFAGDHVSVNCGDEWDTLPFMVRHLGGAGSFFSMVDITMTERHVEWAKKRSPKPGLVSWTNNALDWSHMADYLVERTEGTQQCFVKMGVGHKMLTTFWGTPAAMLMCAGGFAFDGDRAWLNGRVFCVDTEGVCEAMTKLYPKEKFVSTRPGQTFVMHEGRLQRTEDSTPFLTTEPRQAWPSRAKSASDETPDYAPATGRREATAEDLARLEGGLREFAASLVGGTIFRGLCSLLDHEAFDRAVSFALVVRTGDGDGRRVYVYDPASCAFVPGPDDPRASVLAGMECWATDLAAVLQGELGPIALTYGRARLWNALPARFAFDLFGELYRVSHPLRRPAQTLATYGRIWHRVKDTVPMVAARAR